MDSAACLCFSKTRSSSVDCSCMCWRPESKLAQHRQAAWLFPRVCHVQHACGCSITDTVTCVAALSPVRGIRPAGCRRVRLCFAPAAAVCQGGQILVGPNLVHRPLWFEMPAAVRISSSAARSGGVYCAETQPLSQAASHPQHLRLPSACGEVLVIHTSM